MKMQYLKNVSTLKLDALKCINCGMCIEVCPHNVFMTVNNKAFIRDINDCMECGACKTNCPADAITVNAGVGCAGAIYSGILNNAEPSCGCSGTKTKKGCCS